MGRTGSTIRIHIKTVTKTGITTEINSIRRITATTAQVPENSSHQYLRERGGSPFTIKTKTARQTTPTSPKTTTNPGYLRPCPDDRRTQLKKTTLTEQITKIIKTITSRPIRHKTRIVTRNNITTDLTRRFPISMTLTESSKDHLLFYREALPIVAEKMRPCNL